MINYLFFFLLVVYPFGVLAKLPTSFPNINFYLIDLLTFFISFTFFLLVIVKKIKIKVPPFSMTWLLFLVWSGITLIVTPIKLTGTDFLTSALYLIRLISYLGLYLALFNFNGLNKNKSKTLEYLVVIGSFISFFGFIQFILWPNLKTLEIFGWDPHAYRLTSTFLDPGFAGILLVLTLILIFGLYRGTKQKGLIFAGIISYFGLIITQSRASWLAFFVAITFLAWLQKRRLFYFLLAVITVLIIIFMPRPEGEGGKITRVYSVEARIGNWQETINLFQKHPFFGVGYNTLRYAKIQANPDSKEQNLESHSGAGADASLLFVLVTTGLVGLIIYIGFLVKIFFVGFKERKNSWGIIILPTLASLLVHSLFLNSLFYPWVIVWLIIILSSIKRQG